MSKRVAVILSGCGVYDGSEIHEATLSLLALDQEGTHVQCYAPDVDQMHVIDHTTGKEMEGARNVLIESARVARGNIKALSSFIARDYDAILLPGGFGAAKNLSSFALDGSECEIHEDVEKALVNMNNAGKPIGALCISPAILARLFKGAKVTIGAEGDVADAITQGMDGEHVVTTHGEVVVDEKLNLITSPCYMLDASISQVYDGARNVVKELLARAK